MCLTLLLAIVPVSLQQSIQEEFQRMKTSSDCVLGTAACSLLVMFHCERNNGTEADDRGFLCEYSFLPQNTLKNPAEY